MQSFWHLLKYLKNYRLNVALNVLANILTALFTVVSLPLMIPFFNVLFEQSTTVSEDPGLQWSISGLLGYASYYFSQYVTQQGKEAGLILICGTILGSFFLKKSFPIPFPVFYGSRPKRHHLRYSYAGIPKNIILTTRVFFS